MLCLRILVQAGYTGNQLLRAQEKGGTRGVWWGLGLVSAIFGQAPPPCAGPYFMGIFFQPLQQKQLGVWGMGRGWHTRLEGYGFEFTNFTPQVSSLYGRAG